MNKHVFARWSEGLGDCIEENLLVIIQPKMGEKMKRVRVCPSEEGGQKKRGIRDLHARKGRIPVSPAKNRPPAACYTGDEFAKEGRRFRSLGVGGDRVCDDYEASADLIQGTSSFMFNINNILLAAVIHNHCHVKHTFYNDGILQIHIWTEKLRLADAQDLSRTFNDQSRAISTPTPPPKPQRAHREKPPSRSQRQPPPLIAPRWPANLDYAPLARGGKWPSGDEPLGHDRPPKAACRKRCGRPHVIATYVLFVAKTKAGISHGGLCFL
ncbi:hypothetical protein KSP40_PGU020451 [Platanthera guangdongensis]|uniref:Uncharacterized protein n=1 Tax=Platanthera guangdongensis TaxID=2320717 RepID=A0ABR2MZS7_9ASPA